MATVKQKDKGTYIVKVDNGEFYVTNCFAIMPFLAYHGIKWNMTQRIFTKPPKGSKVIRDNGIAQKAFLAEVSKGGEPDTILKNWEQQGGIVRKKNPEAATVKQKSNPKLKIGDWFRPLSVKDDERVNWQVGKIKKEGGYTYYQSKHGNLQWWNEYEVIKVQKPKRNPNKKISKTEAKRLAVESGIDFDKDVHSLRFSEKDLLSELARRSGYRKSSSSSMSLGSAFFQHLSKKNPVENIGTNRDYKTRAKSITLNLRVHKILMDYWISQGMDKTEASSKAMHDLQQMSAKAKKDFVEKYKKNPSEAKQNPYQFDNTREPLKRIRKHEREIKQAQAKLAKIEKDYQGDYSSSALRERDSLHEEIANAERLIAEYKDSTTFLGHRLFPNPSREAKTLKALKDKIKDYQYGMPEDQLTDGEKRLCKRYRRHFENDGGYIKLVRASRNPNSFEVTEYDENASGQPVVEITNKATGNYWILTREKAGWRITDLLRGSKTEQSHAISAAIRWENSDKFKRHYRKSSQNPRLYAEDIVKAIDRGMVAHTDKRTYFKQGQDYYSELKRTGSTERIFNKQAMFDIAESLQRTPSLRLERNPKLKKLPNTTEKRCEFCKRSYSQCRCPIKRNPLNEHLYNIALYNSKGEYIGVQALIEGRTALAAVKKGVRTHNDLRKRYGGELAVRGRVIVKGTKPEKKLNSSRRNPNERYNTTKLDELSAMFQGHISGDQIKTVGSDFTPNLVSRIGQLSLIRVKNGSKIYELSFDGDSWLGMDARKNLHINGKDTRIKNVSRPRKGELHLIGNLEQINYITAKDHIENGELVEYYHKLGEVDGIKPTLWLDHDNFLVINGGNYDIGVHGIEN